MISLRGSFLIICYIFCINITFAESIQEQFKNAPESERFLHEKRFIPGNENVGIERFSDESQRQQETQVKQENKITEKRNGEKQPNKDKQKINSVKPKKKVLANWVQILVLVSFIVLFVSYRVQISKKRGRK